MQGNISSTFADDNHEEIIDGKEIRPPLIPSNTDQIYSNKGTYNLKGFYEDLNLRLDRQKELMENII